MEGKNRVNDAPPRVSGATRANSPHMGPHFPLSGASGSVRVFVLGSVLK